ncbi:hypothetical protein [Rhodococcus sp. WY5]|uniref:hypothetical protein n=1 Tax=Rhodococcus sp. WY5 TaxID=2708349 RepID=UPI002032C255|nr:hypothetical protein [Rhodococcus sp. WY5]
MLSAKGQVPSADAGVTDEMSGAGRKISEHMTLMGVSRRTAQNAFTDERLLAFAQSLAVSLSDEAPGADLIAFERSISMLFAAVGLTTAALAEALKVAHINLDDIEAVTGLSLLSTLGMITADARTSLVPTPRPLLLRIARYLDAARGIHPARREPPRRTRRSQPLLLRRHPRPERRRNPHPRQQRRRRHPATVAHSRLTLSIEK